MLAVSSADVAAVNVAIASYQRSFQWQTALGLLSDMPQARMNADIISFSSATWCPRISYLVVWFQMLRDLKS